MTAFQRKLFFEKQRTQQPDRVPKEKKIVSSLIV